MWAEVRRGEQCNTRTRWRDEEEEERKKMVKGAAVVLSYFARFFWAGDMTTQEDLLLFQTAESDSQHSA